LTFIGRVLFGSPFSDFHCGLRAFDTVAMRNLNLKTHGMEFASEMVIRATLEHLNWAEVPVTLYPDGRRARPTYEHGVMAGDICASCCCIAHVGYSFTPVYALWH
jgi:hypothetical protein